MTSNPASQAMQFFIARGYTPAQAAGIVGNLQHESGFNTRASHDQGTGYGIAGWRDPKPGQGRWTGLRNYAQQNQSDPSDLNTQLGFVDWELKNKEHKAREALMRAQSPQEAAAAFLHFERPQGYDPTNLMRSHGAANRVALARNAFDTLGAGLPPAPAQATPATNPAAPTGILAGTPNTEAPATPAQPGGFNPQQFAGLLAAAQQQMGPQAVNAPPMGLLQPPERRPIPQFDAQRFAGLLAGRV